MLGVCLAWLVLSSFVDSPEELSSAQFIATVAFVGVTYWLVTITRSTLDEARRANDLQEKSFRVISVYPHIHVTVERRLISADTMSINLVIHNHGSVTSSNVHIHVFRYTDTTYFEDEEPVVQDEYKLIHSHSVAQIPREHKFQLAFDVENDDPEFLDVLVQHTDMLGRNHMEVYEFIPTPFKDKKAPFSLFAVHKEPEKQHQLVHLLTWVEESDDHGKDLRFKSKLRFSGEGTFPDYLSIHMLDALKDSSGIVGYDGAVMDALVTKI